MVGDPTRHPEQKIDWGKKHWILKKIKDKYGTTTNEAKMIFNYAGKELSWDEAFSMLESKLSNRTRRGERKK